MYISCHFQVRTVPSGALTDWLSRELGRWYQARCWPHSVHRTPPLRCSARGMAMATKGSTKCAVQAVEAGSLHPGDGCVSPEDPALPEPSSLPPGPLALSTTHNTVPWGDPGATIMREPLPTGLREFLGTAGCPKRHSQVCTGFLTCPCQPPRQNLVRHVPPPQAL